MPGTTLPPSQSAVLNGPTGLIGRVERLERRTAPPTPLGNFDIVFSYPGALSVAIESPPWYPPAGGAIRVVRVSLLAAATSNHVINVKVGGAVAQQFTLPTGELTIVVSTAIEFTPVSFITVETVAVTDSDLTVQITAG